jgi:hypothetical protein
MASFLTTRETHPRTALKTVIFFVDQYDCAEILQDGLQNFGTRADEVLDPRQRYVCR